MGNSATAGERLVPMLEDRKLDTWAHLPYLRDVARGSVLEVGVQYGISTTALLAGVEEHGGHVWSLDVFAACRYVWYGHPQWTFHDLRGDGVPEPALPLDVLFIDGDHSYGAVLADLETWAPQVRSGGMVLCHDADTPAFPGVRQAIDEYCSRRGLLHELRTGSHGLEVIHV